MPGKGEAVLAIGCAHLDVMGVFRDVETRDKQGKVRFSIGGVAYNVAANLGISRINVSLYAYLAKGSALSDLVLRNIKKCGIRRKYVYVQTLLHGERIGDSAFVAHWNEEIRDVASAVSYMAIGESDWHDDRREGRRLVRAIRDANVIVLDCGLRANTIRYIVKTISEQKKSHNRKPLLVGATSETKCVRFCDLPLSPDEYADVIVMYAEELSYLFQIGTAERKTFVSSLASGDLKAGYSAQVISDRAKARNVVLAFRDHAMVYSHNGAVRRFEMPDIVEFVSATGTRDAMLAAFCAEILSLGNRYFGAESFLDSPTFKERLASYVERVRRVFGATPLSAIDFRQEEDPDHSTRLERWGKRIKQSVMDLLSDAVVQLLVSVALAVSLLILGHITRVFDLSWLSRFVQP